MTTSTLQEIAAQVAEQRRLHAALAANPRPCAFRMRGGTAVIHANTHPGHVGDWRVSYLTEDDEPSGHAEASDFAEALTIARRAGADLSAEVKP